MTEPQSIARSIDPEDYSQKLAPALSRMAVSEQLAFALECTSRVAAFFRIFDSADLVVEHAVQTVELWLRGECMVDDLRLLKPKVNSAFERAMDAYDVTDKWHNIYNATPAGVIAYQATEAARCAQDLLSAAIYSTEPLSDDFLDVAGYCADAAAGALAATIFNQDELDRQSQFLARSTQ